MLGSASPQPIPRAGCLIGQYSKPVHHGCTMTRNTDNGLPLAITIQGYRVTCKFMLWDLYPKGKPPHGALYATPTAGTIHMTAQNLHISFNATPLAPQIHLLPTPRLPAPSQCPAPFASDYDSRFPPTKQPNPDHCILQKSFYGKGM